MRMRSWTLRTLLTALLVLVAACGSPPPPTAGEAGCRTITDLNAARRDRDSPVATGARTVVVLGDSYAQGIGLPDARAQAWPAPFGQATRATVWVDAIGSTGFVSGGYCQNQSFSTRVAEVLDRRPDEVVVQAGLNDLTARPEVLTAAVTRLLDALGPVREVVVVGPTSPPRFSSASVQAADATIDAATAAAGRRYVSALGWRLPWLRDQVHPTPEGHAEYARLLATTAS